MMDFANTLLRTRGKPASYRAPGSQTAIPIRVILTDSATELRASGTSIVADEAEATVSALAPVERLGEIDYKGTTYEIVSIVYSAAPGLLDLGLVRLTGEAQENFNLSRQILKAAKTEPVSIGGVEVKAVVNRRGQFIEQDPWGGRIEVMRTVLGVSLEDAAGVQIGSPVFLSGEEHRVSRVLRDGASMALLVL